MNGRSRKSEEHGFWRSTDNIGRLLDNSPDSMFVSRIDNFRFVDVNERAIEHYGYSREEFLQMQIFDIEVEAPVREEVRQLYDKTPIGEVIEVTGVNKRSDGSTFPVQVRFCKLDDHYAVANVRDITLQKQADEELEKRVKERTSAAHESGLRLAEILDGAEEAIVSVDENQSIILFNKGAQRIFGYKETEVIGRPFDVLISDYGQTAHRLQLKDFSDGSGSRPSREQSEIFGQRKNGEPFPAEASISRIDDGSIQLFTIFLRDVTERRRLEKEVLEIGERERRRVGQDLHDDLGQHLTGIGFIAEELEQRLAEQGLVEEATAMGTMINLVEEAKTKTRDLSRGLYPIELETGGLPMLLQDLAVQTEKIYGISCVVSVDHHLSVESIGTQEALYHIAQEAVTNAVRHAQPNRIDIRLNERERGVTMSVKDDGCGLPDDIGECRGMGLRIMRYRARLINGELEIICVPGGGTVVKCRVRGSRA